MELLLVLIIVVAAMVCTARHLIRKFKAPDIHCCNGACSTCYRKPKLKNEKDSQSTGGETQHYVEDP